MVAFLGQDHAAAEWTVRASAVNAAANAQKAAEGGSHLVVASVHGSFSAAAIALMQIVEDPGGLNTLKWAGYVHNQRDVIFTRPLKIVAGKAVKCELSAGGVGITGESVITGYTI